MCIRDRSVSLWRTSTSSAGISRDRNDFIHAILTKKHAKQCNPLITHVECQFVVCAYHTYCGLLSLGTSDPPLYLILWQERFRTTSVSTSCQLTCCPLMLVPIYIYFYVMQWLAPMSSGIPLYEGGTSHTEGYWHTEDTASETDITPRRGSTTHGQLL